MRGSIVLLLVQVVRCLPKEMQVFPEPPCFELGGQGCQGCHSLHLTLHRFRPVLGRMTVTARNLS